MRIALVGVLVATTGCAWFTRREPVSPDTTFAAHAVSGGIVIDKSEGGQSGVLEPSTTPREGPQLVLRSPAGAITVALWLNGLVATVRRAPDATAPVVGRVDARFEEGALLLRLQPDGAAPYGVSEFKRLSGGASPAALGQPASLLTDLRGMYRADVTDASGTIVGWMRVEVDARWQPGHVYEAVLPRDVDGPLAVAAVAQIDAVLSGVEANAVNPYIGN